MIKVFVSGCYDILHGGHLDFFEDARSLGDHLTVCFAGDDVYRVWKGRHAALPQDSRRSLLQSLRCVDSVVMSRMTQQIESKPWMDWLEWFHIIQPDVMAVTEDDRNYIDKLHVCDSAEVRFVRLPKTARHFPISTTAIRERAGL